MKRHSLLFLLLLSVSSSAFAAVQHGTVKTRGRLGENGKVIAGTPLAGVSVVLKGGSNSTVSAANGTFTLTVPAGKFHLHNVVKKGYSIVDPDALSKEYATSSNELVLVMESLRQMESDKLAYGRKIRRTLEANIQAKQAIIDSLLEAKKLSEEQYVAELRKLNAEQDNSEKLVAEMAERYARMDFDKADDFQRRVADMIISGKLREADSLLNTKGSMEARAKEIDRIREANSKEAEELKQREEKLSGSREMMDRLLEDFGADCLSRHEIANLKHDIDSAAYWLRLRADKAPENIRWQIDAGLYFFAYTADYKLAEEYNQRALKTAISKFGDESEETSAPYNNLALIYATQSNEFDKAEEAYTKAIRIAEKNYGPSHPIVAILLTNLGDLQLTMGKAAEGEGNLMKAVDIWQSDEYRDSCFPNEANTCLSLSTLYLNKGEFAKSIECLDKALEIQIANYGKEHPDVALTHNSYGTVYYQMAEYDEALRHHMTALDMRLKFFGENHPAVIVSNTNIATVYEAKGEYQQAIDLLEKCYTGIESHFGSTHSLTAVILNNLSQTYLSAGKYKEGLDCALKSLETKKILFGDNNIELAFAHNNAGFAYRLCNRIEKALEHYTTALTLLQKANAFNIPLAATILTNMGNILASQNELSVAMECLEQALTLSVNLYGEDHPTVAGCYMSIGSVFKLGRDFARAHENYDKALAIYRKNSTTKNRDLGICLGNIGETFIYQNQCEKALDYIRESLSIKLDVLGPKHLETATSYNNLGVALANTGALEEAADALRKSLDIRELFLDPSDFQVLGIYNALGDIESRRKNMRDAVSYWLECTDRLVLNPSLAASNLSDIYKKIYSAFTENPHIRVRGLGVNEFLSDKIFTATVLSDRETPAAKRGMAGEYVLLEFGDWKFDSALNVYDVNADLTGKPKSILVMKDDKVKRYDFEDSIGIVIEIKTADKTERERILTRYKSLNN